MRRFVVFGFDENDRKLILAVLELEPIRETRMPVAPCMEEALGYRGFRRYVAFKIARLGLVYWTDGIDDGLAEVAILDQFLKHPLVFPHVSRCRLQGRAVAAEELTVFESPAEALRIELEELGDAMLLDRERRVVWTGLFAQVFLYLTVATACEELPDFDEGDTDYPHIVDAALQMQLLDWLDCRHEGVSNVIELE
jgi:hypothetical protein